MTKVYDTQGNRKRKMGELTADLERHDLIESANKRYALGNTSIS